MDKFERAIYGLSAHVEHDALAALRAADDAVYGAAKPYLQVPLVGSLAGAVPYVGDYFRAHEQSLMTEDYFNDNGITSSQVTYPVSAYGSMLPAYGYMASSLGGFISNRRRSKRRKSYHRVYRSRVPTRYQRSYLRRKYGRRY